MLAAAVIAAVGGFIACCALPGSGSEEEEEEEEQEKKQRREEEARAADARMRGEGGYAYNLTGIDSVGGSSSSPGSTANMLVSPGSPRSGSRGQLARVRVSFSSHAADGLKNNHPIFFSFCHFFL